MVQQAAVLIRLNSLCVHNKQKPYQNCQGPQVLSKFALVYRRSDYLLFKWNSRWSGTPEPGQDEEQTAICESGCLENLLLYSIHGRDRDLRLTPHSPGSKENLPQRFETLVQELTTSMARVKKK